MIQSWDKMYSMFKCPKIRRCAEMHRHLRTHIYWVEKQDFLDF